MRTHRQAAEGSRLPAALSPELRPPLLPQPPRQIHPPSPPGPAPAASAAAAPPPGARNGSESARAPAAHSLHLRRWRMREVVRRGVRTPPGVGIGHGHMATPTRASAKQAAGGPGKLHWQPELRQR
ncbi:cbp/p300-interacting transactivator 4-like [Cavia porcellus]|uniref:cbp/p300-interacting transactivator 4-like n=1 Tax=Cavia porcellus TaxID=10141 RepID=UPI002FE19926